MKLSTDPSSSELCTLEREIQRTLSSRLKDRRTSVFVSRPSDEDLDQDHVNFSRKYLDLVTLLGLCHYSFLLEEYEILLRLSVADYLERNLLFPELNASSISRRTFLFLVSGRLSYVNPNIFFGNCLSVSSLRRTIKRIKFFKKDHGPVKYSIRRRGYKDKGSLRPSERWTESFDISFTEAQLKKEENQVDYLNLVARISEETSGSESPTALCLENLRKEVSLWHSKNQGTT